MLNDDCAICMSKIFEDESIDFSGDTYLPEI